jgi:GMP synthase (glutamine-hydrolysing)
MILIVNFGGQFCYLINRIPHRLGFSSEIISYDVDLDTIQSYRYAELIFSGGAKYIYVIYAAKINEKLFELGIPIL